MIFKSKNLLIFVLFSLIVLSYGDEADDSEKVVTEEKPKYVKPVPKGHHHFLETFDLNTIGSKWIKSLAKKADVEEVIAKYEGEWSIEASTDSALDGDKGLVLKSKAKHHAISARLLKPFDFKNDKPLVVQYEVKFQNPLECGGAYVKLLTDSADLKLDNFLDKTPYTIMFGPDKCGGESKNHFIIRYKHPLKGTFEEKHAKRTENIDPYFSDGKTHLYTLILRPDNRYQMFIDQTEVNSGSLLTDFTPAINPEKEIIDPEDKKPETWDDREKIPDPDAKKPDDWDENEPKTIVDTNAVKPDGWLDDEELTIPDPNAVKPDDWDDDTDGEWEAPKIDNPVCKSAAGCGKWEAPVVDNPKYKGKWRAPMIDNPSYQGKWEPRKIPNPDYYEDKDPFKSLTSFSAIGLELWSMTDNIYFDNFFITDDESIANEFAKDSWEIKKTIETKNSKSGDSVVDALVNAARDKPWLWAVYVLVGLVPIVLIAVFCFGRGKQTTTTQAQAQAQRTETNEDAKKTDEQTADDDEPKEEAASTNEQTVEEPERTEEDIEPVEVDKSNDGDKSSGDGSKATTSPRKRRTQRKE